MRFNLMVPTAVVLMCAISGPLSAEPVVVACGPGQHTIVRHTVVRGDPATRVECVGGATYRPVRYYHAERRHRSWGKTALVVAGGAGTGAGVGGAIHGKKGALIGAALGGGVASLYEAAHRR